MTSNTAVVLPVSLLVLYCLFNNEVSGKELHKDEGARNNTTAPNLVDETAANLFTVLNKFDDFDINSCDPVSPDIPDFKTPGRRISEIKCLEYLWRMRYYDHLLVRHIRCGLPFDPSLTVIIGGTDASPGQFPHMGAVGWKGVNGSWVFKCGATLVTEKFMVTAGHCSRARRSDQKIIDPVPKIVRLGETNIEFKDKEYKPPQDVEIKRIIVHPYYRSPIKYYDIAIIELVSPVMFTILSHPACIWSNQFQEVHGTAALTGWGVTETGGNDAHPILQFAKVDVVDLLSCDRMLHSSRNRHWKGLVYHQMCAGDLKGGVDSCQGDSGGPLQMDIHIPGFTDWKMHYILGVTSFGYGCGRPNTPSVYTRVSSFVNWIESIVWEEDYYKMNNITR